MKKDNEEVYTELLVILNNMDIQYKQKVPKELIEFYEKNSSKEYQFQLEKNIPLKRQNIRPKTLSLLAMLYLNYWCKDEIEKQALIKLFSENEEKYQDELKKKYDIDFGKHKRIKDKQGNTDRASIIVSERKESILKRVINRIKDFFR